MSQAKVTLTEADQPDETHTIVHIDAPTRGHVALPAVAIYGWIASRDMAAIATIELRNRSGDRIPLGLVDRPDVRESTAGFASSGFSGWIDIRAAADGPWEIHFANQDIASYAPFPITVEGEIARRFMAAKRNKLQRVRTLLRCPRCRGELTDTAAGLVCDQQHAYAASRDAFDFLDDDLRARVRAIETENVSAHGYDGTLLELIAQSTGPIIDVGAGLRPSYREDVVNVEIVPYPTTDVIAASEFLPFADNTFDLVISVAVLEHVRDPFVAARELQRILRPGGRIFAAVPFLQPYHAYPDHYYNMTAGGLQNLFRELEVERLDVPLSGGPIYALTWMLQLWRSALPPGVAADFDNMRVGDLAVDPLSLIDMPFVRALPAATNVQLASLNVLVGRKGDA